jgi:hypothetical protein
MKVRVEVSGLPALYEALKRNTVVEVEFQGRTVRELMAVLVVKFGSDVGKTLLNDKGDFKFEIRILLNGVIYPVETIMRAPLHDGDTLVFATPS